MNVRSEMGAIERKVVMENIKSDKIERILGIYTKLIHGHIVNKAEEAQNYHVNERSIQRDIDDIRRYFENDAINKGIINLVIYDRAAKGYRLEQMDQKTLSNSEVLAVCKILLDSRAFTKSDMNKILHKLVACCVPKENQKVVKDLIGNEVFHYVELRHSSCFMDTLWELGQAIRECQYIEINYTRMKDKKTVTRKLKPVAIMFSEYYFYLTAFIDEADEARQNFDVLNDSFPTIYRIDRIQKLQVQKEKFHIPYRSRFEEGEFRKRVQFMYGGKLEKVLFRYKGHDIDAVLDRLPTAQILKEEKGVYTIRAEVFGKGIEMWLRSQGENVEVVDFFPTKGKGRSCDRLL